MTCDVRVSMTRDVSSFVGWLHWRLNANGAARMCRSPVRCQPSCSVPRPGVRSRLSSRGSVTGVPLKVQALAEVHSTVYAAQERSSDS